MNESFDDDDDDDDDDDADAVDDNDDNDDDKNVCENKTKTQHARKKVWHEFN